MSFLLDTCALSEFVKPVSNDGFLKWFDAHKKDEMFITTLSLGELQKGVEKLPSSTRKVQLIEWLVSVENTYQNKFLSFSKEVAKRWGTLSATMEKSGTPMPLADSLIAATAIHHNLSIVTRNEKDFRFAPIEVINPWS